MPLLASMLSPVFGSAGPLGSLLAAAQSGGLTIDWTQMPTYNTIMAVATGAGLLLVVRFGRKIASVPQALSAEGYAMAFAVLGFILTVTGGHMTLTWPLAAYFPFDNIVFGEPSFGFGVLMLGAAFYLWKRGRALLAGTPDGLASDAASGPASGIAPARALDRVVRPVSLFVAGLGLGLFGIAAAGVTYQLFAAPPEEPIAGAFAAYPWIEATFISGLYALVGAGAVGLPWALSERADRRRPARRVVGWAWTLAGWTFLLFGAMNYFTHIGLIVNIMQS